MTIQSAFNEITETLGGTPSADGTITGAIDALNDTLAGSDQKRGSSIEDGVRLLGEHIGSGGDSDFTTANVTIQNSTNTPILTPYIIDSEQMDISMSVIMPDATPTERTIILYKGKALLNVQSGTVATTGSIEDIGQGGYIITGDCTVTVIPLV